MYVSDTVVLPVLRSSTVPASVGGRLRPPSLVAVGDGSRAEYPIGKTLDIGRLSSNDIVLEDPKVSRSHAIITKLDGQAVIRDLNSANGTQVNGRNISGDQPLQPGDTITVGDTSFVYHDDLTRARPRLVPVGSGSQPEYLVTGTLGIGRGADNAIVIRDLKASRRHAFVAIQDGMAIVRDLESLNGTRVNGQLVYGDQVLRDADIITIGDTSFVYHNDLERV
jgi:ABC transport system ATP-binding/permease protein